MRAALYARYSTERQSEASIEDQLRVCERLAARHEFQVVARFRDAAISGGTIRRPGYQAMLAAARRDEFDVIVAEDTSRLWRLLAEQAPRLAELEDLGIHVVTHDLDTRSESAGVLGAVGGAMAEQYRREIGRRTRRGLEGLVQAGKSAGGRAYGYRSATDAGRVQRVVHEEQAAVVRRIFEAYVAGASAKTIAAQLNRDGVPSPGTTWARKVRRRSAWLASAITGDPARGIGILNNDSYRGRLVWNRCRWIRSAADASRRRCVLNPRSEWIESRDESMRIVSDELWQRVKARQRQRSDLVGSRIKAGLSKRQAATGREPGHLFSGWLTCGLCGSRFTLVNRRSYACASHANGRACSNTLHVRRDIVEARLLKGVRERLSSDEVVTEIERRVRKALAARRKRPVRPARLETLRAEIENLVTAIAGGGLRRSAALGRRLAGLEAELESLEAQARGADQVIAAPVKVDVRGRFKRMLERLPEVLGQEPARARAALREVLSPEIILRPAPGGTYLEAEFGLEMTTPLALAAGASETMVAGAGFEPATFGL